YDLSTFDLPIPCSGEIRHGSSYINIANIDHVEPRLGGVPRPNIPKEYTTEANSLDNAEEDTYQLLDNAEYTTKANSPLSKHSPQFQQSNRSDENTRRARSEPCHTHASGSIGHRVSSTSGGSHRLAFLARHPGGDDTGSSLRRDAGLPEPFVLAWNLTTHSILNEAESYRDMMINLVTPGV
nr:hypothetical protein [Tanacetum cinerariifolium]